MANSEKSKNREEQESNRAVATVKPKRPYSRPQIRALGSIKEMTLVTGNTTVTTPP
jgi:hypothetical protein